MTPKYPYRQSIPLVGWLVMVFVVGTLAWCVVEIVLAVQS